MWRTIKAGASLGLRGRFLLAHMGLAAILIGGFTFAVDRFFDRLEARSVLLRLSRALEQVEAAYRADPSRMPVLPEGFSGYLVKGDDFNGAPTALRAVPEGGHSSLMVDGRMETVARRRIGDATLYLTLRSDIDVARSLEHELWTIAAIAGGIALCIAALVALWLSHIVLGPVSMLARNLRQLEPSQPRTPLLDGGADAAIQAIAEAFDRAVDRYDEVIEREREFNRDASHELRTPLAVILTSAELLASDTALPVSQRTHVARIRAAAKQMKSLAEGLLLLSRPGQTTVRAHCVASAVLSEAIDLLRAGFGNRTPEIVCTLERDFTLPVAPGLFLCVVNNLLRNAVEHAAGAPVSVTIGGPGLVVEDRGPGLNPAELATIFAKHVRGRDSSGEGLGLHIVKRVSDRLGWQIEAQNAPHGGLRMVLRVAGQTPTDAPAAQVAARTA